MGETLSMKQTVIAASGTMGVMYLLCAAFVWLAQGWTVRLFGAMFHGIDITSLPGKAVTFGGVVTGLVVVVVWTAIAAAIFVHCYNHCKKYR